MDRLKQLGFTLTELLITVVVVGGGIGWVWNIVKLIQADLVFTGLIIVRIIGVFVPPVGAIVGYF